MKMVLVCIADGVEEMEAVIVIDVLRRAGAEVCVAKVGGGASLDVSASRKVRLVADASLESCLEQIWDLIVLPGGMPGAQNLAASEALRALLQEQLAGQRWLAAICAAPAVVLGRQGLLQGYRATCFPGFAEELQQQAASFSAERVCVDRNLVSSQGPGTAFDFALCLVEKLYGRESAAQLAQTMVYKNEI